MLDELSTSSFTVCAYIAPENPFTPNKIFRSTGSLSCVNKFLTMSDLHQDIKTNDGIS